MTDTYILQQLIFLHDNGMISRKCLLKELGFYGNEDEKKNNGYNDFLDKIKDRLG